MGVEKSQVSEQLLMLHGRVPVFMGQYEPTITRIKLTNGKQRMANYNHGVLTLLIDLPDNFIHDILLDVSFSQHKLAFLLARRELPAEPLAHELDLKEIYLPDIFYDLVGQSATIFNPLDEVIKSDGKDI